MMRTISFETAANLPAMPLEGDRLARRRSQEHGFFQENLIQFLDEARPQPPTRPAASQVSVASRHNRGIFADRQTAGSIGAEVIRERGENKVAKSADTPPVFTPGMSSADRYWAMQPEPVRALRYAKPDEREALAQSLSKQGYAIDAPIMVWGWDPEQTMRLRTEYGYTWVPSAYQPQIQIAPGLAMPGIPSYDPTQPPPGSIRVNLDFLAT